MSRFEVVVYPRELNAAEAALTRLGWEVDGRFGDGAESYGVRFKVPAESVTLELVTHHVSRPLVENLGMDVIAGLCLYVDDADAAWEAARLSGMRLDYVCANGPSTEVWGRLVRAYCEGGLRIDWIQELPAEPAHADAPSAADAP